MNDWRDARDDPPDENQLVFVYPPWEKAYLKDGKWHWAEHRGRVFMTVTHWTPLDPPEQPWRKGPEGPQVDDDFL